MASESKIPYINAYGNITKALNKIKVAAAPERFTQDFLATKLGLSGGGAKPVIPFLKRTGFLGPDGAPTELYKRFRNDAETGAAAAEAMRIGYGALYERNEYIHDASDADLKGIIVEASGLEPGSSTVRSMVASFKALREFADFEATAVPPEQSGGNTGPPEPAPLTGTVPRNGAPQLSLGYTINLHLPPTADIAVFNAIFQSLREHILRD